MVCFVLNVASTLGALIIQATQNSTLMGFFLSIVTFLFPFDQFFNPFLFYAGRFSTIRTFYLCCLSDSLWCCKVHSADPNFFRISFFFFFSSRKEGTALYFIWFILQWFLIGVYIFLAVGINGWGGGYVSYLCNLFFYFHIFFFFFFLFSFQWFICSDCQF
jgi:hypothetical protein